MPKGEIELVQSGDEDSYVWRRNGQVIVYVSLWETYFTFSNHTPNMSVGVSNIGKNVEARVGGFKDGIQIKPMEACIQVNADIRRTPVEKMNDGFRTYWVAPELNGITVGGLVMTQNKLTFVAPSFGEYKFTLEIENVAFKTLQTLMFGGYRLTK